MIARVLATLVVWIAALGVASAETGPFVTYRSAAESLNHQGAYTCIAHLRRTLRSNLLYIHPIVEIEVLSDQRYYQFRAQVPGRATIRVGCTTSRSGRRVLSFVAGQLPGE
jgi:hypothetical protein